MLQFLPAIYPWSYITDTIMEQYPVGSFYLTAETMLPRSSKPSAFWLYTDRDGPVTVVVNDEVFGTIYPSSRLQQVNLRLFDPPATNFIVVDNGIDAPVYLHAAVTHMVKEIEVGAREIYAYSGRTNEQFTNLITSPWSQFLVDYQLPYREYLPDVRSLRIFSTKVAARVLYGDHGTEAGVRDYVSVFTSSTPVVVENRNPELWQPDLYQPVSSADDISGFDFHFWMPNICTNRAMVFTKLMNNVDEFTIGRASHQIVSVTEEGNDEYRQHLVNYSKEKGEAGCSIRDLLIFFGCLDPITAAGLMYLQSSIPICAWSNPLDQMVELPGIGGKFFDSDVDLDSTGHKFPDETNWSVLPLAIDEASTKTLAVEIRDAYNAHDADLTPTWHHATGNSYQIPILPITDLNELRTFCVDAHANYTAHINDTLMHIPADTVYPLSFTPTLTSPIEDLIDFVNDFKMKLFNHQTKGNFDGIYDVDKTTDYWVTESLSRRFDFGGCLDSFPTRGIPADDISCCPDSADAVQMTTVVCESSVESITTPNHPLFGGDDPGLLQNPYFGILI